MTDCCDIIIDEIVNDIEITNATVIDNGGGGGGAVWGGITGTITNQSDLVAYVANAVASVTAASIGLGNVDNTSDANKPVSTAQAAADASVQSYSIQRANHTGTQLASTISDFDTAADARITAQKAAANGLATLDGSSKIPLSQIPASLVGALIFQTTWNASTNSPALASGVGTKGYYYIVSVAGATNLDGITDWKVGDWAVFDGTVWDKIDNTDSVQTVNGQQGVVVLTSDNIAEGSSNLYFLASRVLASILTGLSVAVSTVVTASDTVLVAIGKLQAQVTLRAPIASPTFTGTVGGITAAMVGAPSGSGNSTGNNSGDITITTTGTSGVATLVGQTLNIPEYSTANQKIGSIGGIFNAGSAALTTGTSIAVVCPYAGTISGYSIAASSGTCTVKTWKKSTGTAIPTVSDNISTSGVSLSTGTAVRSSTVTDFTSTAVAAGDIFIFDLSAVATATWVTFQLEITKS